MSGRENRQKRMHTCGSVSGFASSVPEDYQQIDESFRLLKYFFTGAHDTHLSIKSNENFYLRVETDITAQL